jgi:membrane protease YdiL (CAAX protease family)
MYPAVASAINWGLPFYLLGLFGIICFFIRSSPSKSNEITWNPWETLGVTVAIYFVSQILGAALIYIYPLTQGWSQNQANYWFEHNIYGQFLLVLAVEAISLLLLALYLRRRKASFKTIGLKPPRWLRDAGYVILGFGVYFTVYLIVLGILSGMVHIDVNQQQQIGFDNAHGIQLLPVFISLAILPPIAEEIIVRGFLYSGLKKTLPVFWAVLITSVMFATAHLQAGSGQPLLWVAGIDTFILSLVLIYLREKTDSLYASIGLHMLKNTIAFLGLFVFKVM